MLTNVDAVKEKAKAIKVNDKPEVKKPKTRGNMMVKQLYSAYDRFYDERENFGRAGKEIERVLLGVKREARRMSSVGTRTLRRQRGSNDKVNKKDEEKEN